MMIARIKLYRFRKKFRKNNQHNATHAENVFDISQVKIGSKSWGGITLINYDPSHKSQLIIGSFCSIASNVEFLLGGNHRTDRVSTFLFKQSGYIPDNLHSGENIKDKGNIIIDDDVWIGYKSLILPGSHICRGSIIGAGSVVAGEIPPYSIYVGNRVIKNRFSEEIINKLMEIDIEKFDKAVNIFPEKMEKYLYEEVSIENMNALLHTLSCKEL
jgi:acetyltransferase-like isoleucine patch superfamily enzyme